MQPELRLYDPDRPAVVRALPPLVDLGCAVMVWFFALVGALYAASLVFRGCARLVGD